MSKWSVIILFSIVAVVVWIGLEIFFRLRTSDVEPDYQSYLTPITTEFTRVSIDEVNSREEEFLLVERNDLE